MAEIRLDKYLADAGQGSRTQVKALIRECRVTVNETVIRRADYKVNTENDSVLLDGKPIAFEEYQYYMLYKPAGVVSATRDGRDKTVIELINEKKRRDLFPVGRLDKDTEGLLLITNDGKLANRLLAPGKHVKKTYYAEIDGHVTEDTVRIFQAGVDIGDERLTAPAELRILSEKSDGHDRMSKVEVILTEGRYHQIKRMFEAVGMQVVYLKRLSMGSLRLDETLDCGGYRQLTQSELESLAREV